MTENYTDEQIINALIQKGYLSSSINSNNFSVDDNLRFLANNYTLDTAIDIAGNHLYNIKNAVEYSVYVSGYTQLPPVPGVAGVKQDVTVSLGKYSGFTKATETYVLTGTPVANVQISSQGEIGFNGSYAC